MTVSTGYLEPKLGYLEPNRQQLQSLSSAGQFSAGWQVLLGTETPWLFHSHPTMQTNPDRQLCCGQQFSAGYRESGDGEGIKNRGEKP